MRIGGGDEDSVVVAEPVDESLKQFLCAPDREKGQEKKYCSLAVYRREAGERFFDVVDSTVHDGARLKSIGEAVGSGGHRKRRLQRLGRRNAFADAQVWHRPSGDLPAVAAVGAWSPNESARRRAGGITKDLSRRTVAAGRWFCPSGNGPIEIFRARCHQEGFKMSGRQVVGFTPT